MNVWRYSHRCSVTGLEIWLNTRTGNYGWFIAGTDPNAQGQSPCPSH